MAPRDIQADKQQPAERQNVKREKATDVVDAHEREERDFLTPAEMELLLKAAKEGRYGQRDYAMLLLAYRHGLRVSELVALTKRDISLTEGRIWCARRKNGLSTNQPLQGDELRAVRTYLNKRQDSLPWLFISSQGGQMTRQNINYLVAEAGQRAGLGHINPHMLRHSCGHALADKGTDTRLMQDWLGHRDIRHTSWYSRTSAKRFEGIWS